MKDKNKLKKSILKRLDDLRTLILEKSDEDELLFNSDYLRVVEVADQVNKKDEFSTDEIKEMNELYIKYKGKNEKTNNTS